MSSQRLFKAPPLLFLKPLSECTDEEKWERFLAVKAKIVASLNTPPYIPRPRPTKPFLEWLKEPHFGDEWVPPEELKALSPLVTITSYSVLCPKRYPPKGQICLPCKCDKVHIQGSVWKQVTRALERVILFAKVDIGGYNLTHDIDTGRYKGIPLHRIETMLYQPHCKIADCPACKSLAAISSFYSYSFQKLLQFERGATKNYDAICLLSSPFFPILGGGHFDKEDCDRFNVHDILTKGWKLHPYRRSAFQAMFILLGQVAERHIPYSQKIKSLCEEWFDLTKKVFAPENLKSDHSDKMNMFDPVFAANDESGRKFEDTDDTEQCTLCNDGVNEGKKLVRAPCAHVFCVECLKQWRMNSPVGQQDDRYRYRCPFCRKCLVCGKSDCTSHTLIVRDLAWPVSLSQILERLAFARVYDMQASEYVKLRENTRQERAAIAFHWTQCEAIEAEDGNRNSRAWRLHFEYMNLALQIVQTKYRLSTMTYVVDPKNPRKVHDWSYSSDCDAFDWCAQEEYPRIPPASQHHERPFVWVFEPTDSDLDYLGHFIFKGHADPETATRYTPIPLRVSSPKHTSPADIGKKG